MYDVGNVIVCIIFISTGRILVNFLTQRWTMLLFLIGHSSFYCSVSCFLTAFAIEWKLTSPCCIISPILTCDALEFYLMAPLPFHFSGVCHSLILIFLFTEPRPHSRSPEHVSPTAVTTLCHMLCQLSVWKLPLLHHSYNLSFYPYSGTNTPRSKHESQWMKPQINELYSLLTTQMPDTQAFIFFP